MNKKTKYNYTLALALVLSTTVAYAQTDSDLIKSEIKNKIEKKLEDKKEEGKLTTEDSAESTVDKVASEVPTALDQVSIEADDLTFDKETKTLTAENNVVMGYKDKQIKAQKIEYDQDSRMITADDGVEFSDDSGTVFRAENLMVTDKFDKGEMKNVSVDFGDESTFTAEELTILDVNKYDLRKSTYSPCSTCDKGKYLWQVDAQKIFYNEADGRVYYRDAYIKLLGQKIAWLPYLSHPTPYAKSKSGFLTPKFGQSSQYGFFTRVPYYYQPKENLDFTFSPLITSRDGPIMVAEMRHLIESGHYELEISGANTPELNDLGKEFPGGDRKFRGHFKGLGEFEYGENWQYGFDITRSSDDTYLRRYRLGTYEDILKSEVYADRIHGRNFFSTKMLAFQGLGATDDPGQSPHVTPLIDAGRSFQVSDKYNSRIETDLNTMVLTRGEGTDSSRMIGTGKWKGDYTSASGYLFNMSIGTRADYYTVNDVNYLGSNYDGSVQRVMPEASLTMSYPLQKYGETYNLILEPISMVVVSPNGNNNLKIPNEDSQNIDLSDYNLFQENHISGYDIVEDGARVNYGVRGVLSTNRIGDYNFLLGQNYRASKDVQNLNETTGLSDNYSDYVGRIVTGSEKVQSAYRFRMDKDSMRFKRNEITFNLNLDPLQLGTNYTFIEGVNGISSDRQEIATSGALKLTDQFSLISHATRNMDNDNNSGWVSAGTGIVYTNSCISTSLELNREFTRDRDLEPGTELIFKITLQNFGN